MKKLIIIFAFILLINKNVYASEATLIDGNSFDDYVNEKIEECKDEYIVETKNILIGKFILTAYCPCSICCGKETGVTASGAIAQANHTIAADTSVLPFETEVIINGQAYIVEDVGGGINDNHIDIFFNTHSEALDFGKKIENVYKQEEAIKVLKAVEFREYMVITGDLMKRKIAENYYDKSTGNVTWKNSKGEIVATRKKNKNGGYENRVEESIYKEWLRSR